MDTSILPYLLIPLAPVLFVGFWCGVCLLLSVVGGWARLAGQFTAQTPPSGNCFPMQSGRVGWVNYNHCLTVHISPEGLHLAVMFLFRLGHPALFIPWTAVHRAKVKRLFWAETVMFEVGFPKIATLQLSKKILTGQTLPFTPADDALTEDPTP